ncbi:HAD-IA family hydrolase [Zooshikella harenae]|uniref:HAD-IA family hydrolase n=1 Tax=Zooshikella harenae TaxID=2827238 RepID=A0ABS5Z8I0_9GAMM|nr:HAD-IA family hydrolase [Zooshikella harenae]MBU2710349.1 HAD-IA family hydrolase [Zooshikella harenae]
MQTSPIHAILFDLDGTLLDTAPDLVAAVNRLRHAHGESNLDYDLVRNCVSNGAKALVKLAFSITEEDERFTALHQQLLAFYEEQLVNETTLFPGMDHLLQAIESRQLPWGVVTNKPSQYTLPIMDSLALTKRSAVTLCPDHVQQRKPHPEALLTACNQLNCIPQQCIYIGDHERDIEAGQRAGMVTVAACYGYIDNDSNPESWPADFHADSAMDILDWLDDNNWTLRA